MRTYHDWFVEKIMCYIALVSQDLTEQMPAWTIPSDYANGLEIAEDDRERQYVYPAN